MTPLLRTKNPSAPVGDKSGGDKRAARSLLSCALWSGMGRLWRGMGGMGHPEPLSAHRPRRQHGLGVFTNHETRNAAFSPWCARAAQPKPPSGPLSPPASHCFPVRHCSPLFTIVHQKIVLRQCPRAARTAAHAARSLLHRARSRSMVRLSRGMCGGGSGGQASLYFSPRGKAEWVRGPSGRGASCLARAGVLDSTLSTASKRNEVLAVVSRAPAVMW